MDQKARERANAETTRRHRRPWEASSAYRETRSHSVVRLSSHTCRCRVTPKGETAKTTAPKRPAETCPEARRTIRYTRRAETTVATSIRTRPVFTEVPNLRNPPTNSPKAPTWNHPSRVWS